MQKDKQVLFSRNTTSRGSLVSDDSRGIANIDYDNMNNPIRIQFMDENVTKYIYSATGEKLRVIYITAVPNISVPIGSIKELSPSEILCKDSIDYLLGGNLTLRNGRIDKYLFEEGYCQAEAYSSTKDRFTFCYYDRDHLGSVRQVTEADGCKNGYVIQTANYYPFGGELCQGDTKNSIQSHKYNGKEFDNMYGLNTYDYGARQYNPVTGRWDRMDPLCEKYYPTSPFAYCMNNPVRFIDPDGRKIDTSNMSEDELSAYNKLISKLCNNELFATLYNELQKTDNVINVSFGDPKNSRNGNEIYGQFQTAENGGGGNLILQKDAMMNGDGIPDEAVSEEFFHAYQNENASLYTADCNREFEAKTFCVAMYGVPIPYDGMEEWNYSIINFQYGDESSFKFLTPSQVHSNKFQNDYKEHANNYAVYNERNNIGNINYRTQTKCIPFSLINIVNKTYKER